MLCLPSPAHHLRLEPAVLNIEDILGPMDMTSTTAAIETITRIRPYSVSPCPGSRGFSRDSSPSHLSQIHDIEPSGPTHDAPKPSSNNCPAQPPRRALAYREPSRDEQERIITPAPVQRAAVGSVLVAHNDNRAPLHASYRRARPHCTAHPLNCLDLPRHGRALFSSVHYSRGLRLPPRAFFAPFLYPIITRLSRSPSV